VSWLVTFRVIKMLCATSCVPVKCELADDTLSRMYCAKCSYMLTQRALLLVFVK
jgi:hypothetical protein